MIRNALNILVARAATVAFIGWCLLIAVLFITVFLSTR